MKRIFAIAIAPEPGCPALLKKPETLIGKMMIMVNHHSHKTDRYMDEQKEKLWYDMLRYVIENLDNPEFNVEDLAARFSVCAKTMERLFREKLSSSPFAYLRAQRMKKGMELLLNTRQLIKVIPYDVGYASASTFTKAFTKFYKFPPKYIRDHPDQFRQILD